MPQNYFEQLKMSKNLGGLTAPPKPPAGNSSLDKPIRYFQSFLFSVDMSVLVSSKDVHKGNILLCTVLT